MNKYKHLKLKAIELRKKGHTLLEICNYLSLPKTTIYEWIKTLNKLSERTQKQKDCLKKATQKNIEIAKEKRNLSYKQGLEEYEKLSKINLFKEFIMLYMGEGFRKSKCEVGITNSTLELILLAKYWFELIAPNKDLKYNVQIHVDNNENDIKEYWSKNLKIDKNKIKIIRKSNSGNLSGRKWRSVYGVFSIRFCDTSLKCKINAWMQKIKEEILKIS